MFTWLVASDDDLEAAQLRETCTSVGATKIVEASRGERHDFYGRIRSVSYVPADDRVLSPAFEAELFDGSGALTLVWLGQSMITGIVAGRPLRLRGRMALREGAPVIYNPEYTLIS